LKNRVLIAILGKPSQEGLAVKRHTLVINHWVFHQAQGEGAFKLWWVVRHAKKIMTGSGRLVFFT
jgi:hypothetical protein